jgi:hypothetical protein
MKKSVLLLIFVFSLMTTQNNAESAFDNFVSCCGNKLMDGENELRFISFNVTCLHYSEDNHPIEATHPYRLPNEFEITDAIKSVKQMGGQAVRIYVLSVRKMNEDRSIPRHVLAPGEFNEDAFRVLDKVLELANDYGIRVIIPFVCSQAYWGGAGEYAAFREEERGDFWVDPQLIADFKATINYVINRENYYTGIKYKDDKAILAWETGNEPDCPPSWTDEISAYIKSVDKNHLVIDGWAWGVRKESLNNSNVDIVIRHLYPLHPQCCKPPAPDEPQPLLDQLRTARERSKNQKPLIVEEFGLVSTATTRKLLDMVIENGTSGALIWSLRYHNRDGGFYWHTEMGDFRSYHWPGFRSGDPYDETNLLNLMREKAFQIRGLPVPPIEVPEPPVLLPVKEVSAISWQGSAGAKSYDVERAHSDNGPWTTVGKNISDAVSQYKPLFNDTTVEIDRCYYYRVKAKNDAGVSHPSNVVGPVKTEHLTLVDEMLDYSLIHSHLGSLSLEWKQGTSMAKEETYRLKGEAGSHIVYRVAGDILSFKVYTLFPKEISDFKFSISSDGKIFKPVMSERHVYTYRWKPVNYKTDNIPKESKYLKIEFTDTSQISRVEIVYR